MRPLCEWSTVPIMAGDIPMHPVEKSSFMAPGLTCCARLSGIILICCSTIQLAPYSPRFTEIFLGLTLVFMTTGELEITRSEKPGLSIQLPCHMFE